MAESNWGLRPGFLRDVETNAKREGRPLVQEWAKKPRRLGDTVPFMMALERKLIDKEKTCKDLFERFGRDAYRIRHLLEKLGERNQKVKDHALDIKTLRNSLQDVAAYIGHRAIDVHKG